MKGRVDLNDVPRPIANRGLGLKILLSYIFIGPLIGALPTVLKSLWVVFPDLYSGVLFSVYVIFFGFFLGVLPAALTGGLVAIWIKVSLRLAQRIPSRLSLTLGSGLIGLVCSNIWIINLSAIALNDLGGQVLRFLFSPGAIAGAVCGFLAYRISTQFVEQQGEAEPAV